MGLNVTEPRCPRSKSITSITELTNETGQENRNKLIWAEEEGAHICCDVTKIMKLYKRHFSSIYWTWRDIWQNLHQQCEEPVTHQNIILLLYYFKNGIHQQECYQTCAWYLRSLRILPVVKFQTSMNPSTEPVIKYWPSGENLAHSTWAFCPNCTTRHTRQSHECFHSLHITLIDLRYRMNTESHNDSTYRPF